jgi:hypothetical protein
MATDHSNMPCRDQYNIGNMDRINMILAGLYLYCHKGAWPLTMVICHAEININIGNMNIIIF